MLGLVHSTGGNRRTSRRLADTWADVAGAVAVDGLARGVTAVGLMLLSSVADHAFGGFVGYLVLLVGVTVGLWRLEHFCSRQYWRGLRDYQA